MCCRSPLLIRYLELYVSSGYMEEKAIVKMDASLWSAKSFELH
jgi:hypothetical protein